MKRGNKKILFLYVWNIIYFWNEGNVQKILGFFAHADIFLNMQYWAYLKYNLESQEANLQKK